VPSLNVLTNCRLWAKAWIIATHCTNHSGNSRNYSSRVEGFVKPMSAAAFRGGIPRRRFASRSANPCSQVRRHFQATHCIKYDVDDHHRPMPPIPLARLVHRYRQDIGRSAIREHRSEREQNMLFTIAIILCLLWAVGLLASFTLGGFIHILLVLAVVVVAIRLLQGRPATG